MFLAGVVPTLGNEACSGNDILPNQLRFFTFLRTLPSFNLVGIGNPGDSLIDARSRTFAIEVRPKLTERASPGLDEQWRRSVYARTMASSMWSN